MSDGTIWLISVIAGGIGLLLVVAFLEMALRPNRKKRSLADQFDIDPKTFREVHTTFGNPLGGGDIAKANDYMRDQAMRARGHRSAENPTGSETRSRDNDKSRT